MDSKTCKNYAQCPIFSGALQDKEITAKSYRQQYCEAGDAGWSKCKRFQVKEKTGKCPPTLMPNSFKTIEEIIQSMN